MLYTHIISFNSQFVNFNVTSPMINTYEFRAIVRSSYFTVTASFIPCPSV